MQIKLLFFFVLALLVAIFSIYNTGLVTVNYLLGTLEGVPLSAVIIVSVAVGSLIMALFSAPNQVRQSLRIRDLTRRLETAEENLQKETARVQELDQRMEEFLAAQSEAAGERLTEGEGPVA